MRRGVMGREASWDTGAPTIDMAAVGGLATQAGGKLSAMSRGSRSTGSQVLGTAGEGLRNAGMGAGIGASIGSVIPGIGTVIGGAIGAIGGAISGVVHHLLSGPHRHRRKLTPKDRDMLNRGLRIARTRHLPGAFQDAVLYVYTPAVYRSLSALQRLPSQIEARLLQQRTYAAHAAAVDRAYGVRLRRELAHLPPELRTLVGVGSVTGHARELYVALHRALAERARLAHHGAIRPRHAASAFTAPPREEPEVPELLEPTAPPEPEDAQESLEDPFRELPLARDADQDDEDAGGPLDEIALTLEQARRAQRRYLRDSWVNDTWIGDVLHLDQPDDPSAPVAPALSPGSGRPPTITLVPEPDTGAPPTNADEAHAQVLANRPTLPPTAWAPLQAPVQVYFWDPFGSQWRRVGDTDGSDRAKGLVLLLVVSSHFSLSYCLLHTARGTEVIRAVKNPSREPLGDARFGVWRPVGGGVSRFWTPLFTFYARTFQPGEPIRFDFGWAVQPETGDPFDDAAGTDTGDIFDDLYGKRLALKRLRPFLEARRLQAVAPGDRLPAPEDRVFNWSQSWDTREAFDEAFGRHFGGRVLHRMLARGWRFVEVAPESQDAGALGRTHTAQGNETPQAIAKRYDAFSRERWAAELKAANPHRDWTARIYEGDLITIPEAWPQPFWGAAKERGFLEASGPSTEDAGALPRSYSAVEGETPQAIAKRYDALSREHWAAELKAANPHRDWTARIYAGDVIAIPRAWPQPFWGAAKERGFLETSGPSAAETGALTRTYAAAGGETPQAIARRYDALTRERWATELRAANPQRDWTARIYAGDVIAVPEAWPQPFWGAAKERGLLDASGPRGAPALATADPFRELRAQRGRLS